MTGDDRDFVGGASFESCSLGLRPDKGWDGDYGRPCIGRGDRGGLGIMGLRSGAPGMNECISIHPEACVCLSVSRSRSLARSISLSDSFLKGFSE